MKRHRFFAARNLINSSFSRFRPLHAETLEPRTLLATFLVTTDADAGAGSLREAITLANSTAGADAIHFQGARSITLASSLPSITEQVTIDGFVGNAMASPNNQLTSDNAQLVVEINGNYVDSANPGFAGFVIQADNCLVRGISFFNAAADAIRIEGGHGNRIQGNRFGISASGAFMGMARLANGVRVQQGGTGNIIGTDGDGVGDLGERNVIVNSQLGVAITGSTDNVIAGNFIGTSPAGNSAINNFVGIILDARADRTRIGTDPLTPDVNERNVISGNTLMSNGVGIAMARRPVLDSVIFGNYIGTSADGLTAVPNDVGIAVEYGAERITIGGDGRLANRVAYNNGEGVLVSPAQFAQNPAMVTDVLAAAPQRISIRGNAIYANGRLGIDLVLNGGIGDGENPPEFNNDDDDLDPTVTNALLQLSNGLRNRPILTLVRYGSATRVQGTLESQPNEDYTIDFYANNAVAAADAEGEVYLGRTTVRSDATGAASFDVLVGASSLNQFITATATSQYNETSEFSTALPATTQLQAGFDGSDFIVLGDNAADAITIATGAGGAVDVTHNLNTTSGITGRVLIAGFAGADSVTLNGNTASGVFADAGDAGDTYTINFDSAWTGSIVLQDFGVTGSDVVNFNGTAADDQFNKQFTFVDWNLDATPAIVSHVEYVGIETKNVFGNDGNDTILDPGEDTHIFGGPGNDIITVDATSGSGVTVDGGAGNDSYIVRFGKLVGPVTIADSGSAGTDSVTVIGTDADDNFMITNSAVTSGAEVVHYASINALAVNGGAGNDSVVVQSTSSAGVTIDGGEGTDDVSVVPGASPGPVTVVDSGVTGDNLVQVQGTANYDVIIVSKVATNSYQVRVNQNQPLTFRDLTGEGRLTRLMIDALAGNDRVIVNSNVLVSTVIWGNDGNDILQGGSGNNVLIGGAGHDLLWGGRNDDVLVGGAGIDVLNGNGGTDVLIGGEDSDLLIGSSGEDLLIGGTVAFDANQAALLAILAEWSAGRSYSQRVANLTGTGLGAAYDSRLNGEFFLIASGPQATIFNDGDADVLIGGAGRDKFFVASNDIAADRANNE